MECPICNRPVTQSESPDGELRLWCGACGWGMGSTEPIEEQDNDVPTALWALALLWLVAVAFVIGPYFALRFAVPELFDIGLRGVHEAHEKYIALLNGWYGIVMAIYLAAAGLLTPTYDPENVGFFGGMIDNPFSFQDDSERTKRTILLVLLPGKTVWVAFYLTWRRLRG